MDKKLLNILVCPACKGPLLYDESVGQLKCSFDKLAYPIRDGIPIMIADQASRIKEGE